MGSFPGGGAPRHGAAERRGFRRRVLRRRLVGALAVLVGALLLAGSAAAALDAAAAARDVRAFRSAVPCREGHTPRTPDAARRPCLYEVAATVAAGGSGPYALGLDAPPPVPRELRMPREAAPLLGDLRAGDRVTVLMWGGYATAVVHDGVSRRSAHSPVGNPELAAAYALVLLAFGACTLAAGGLLAVRARDLAYEGLPRPLVRLGRTACWAAAAALPAAWTGSRTAGPWAAVAAWLLLVGVIVVVLRLQEARAARRRLLLGW
ncbi:hypothetical protein [Streptomyces sp. TRM64462]|uniref:hypothetical protein n=1 Tax=Streptomyces sp. TRM64462 TaxID=2741726 RepID=UPI001585D8FB|nr:hypothetical protein [Streptomyces sp. TRM64462]